MISKLKVRYREFETKNFTCIFLQDDISHLSNEVVKTSKISGLKGPEKRLPEFTEHPVDSYVVKNRPAILNCSVIHSDKVRKMILAKKYFLVKWYKVNLGKNIVRFSARNGTK